jgi:VWFA-related protein
VRRGAVTAAVALMLLGSRPAGQQPVFRGGVDGVSVPVSVRKGNAAVPGLTSKDFELQDNGVPQTITAFTVEALPIDVTLLLHVSRSIAGYRLEWLKSSVTETSARLKSDDRLRLIAVQHRLREFVPFQPGGARPSLESLTAGGGTSLYDALTAAMIRASEPDRRQLIVAFTTGIDTISIVDQKTAEAVAGLADAVVHLVVPVGGSSSVRKSALADAAAPLGSLVARTGGQIFATDIDKPMGGAFTQAIDEFRTSYVLRYVPSGVPRGGWHDIAVTVKGGPYDVRARKGYGG